MTDEDKTRAAGQLRQQRESAYQQRVDELLAERQQREAERKQVYERIQREQHAKKMQEQLRLQRERLKREREEARAKLKKTDK